MAPVFGGLRQPVECVVTVDGQEITDLYPYLKEVTVEMSRRAATVCRLLFESIRKEDGEWIVQDAGIFEPWNRILVEAHFGDHAEEVMRGFIREIHVDCPEDMGSATVTITGQDESLLLDRQHVRRVLSTAEEPLSDGQIAEQIARAHGLDAQADPGLTNAALNIDSTHVQFLKRRAQANGYELFVRKGTLHFEPPPLEGEPQPTIMVYAGTATNCLSFSARHNGHRPDRVRVVRAPETGTESEDEVFPPNLPLLGQAEATSAAKGLDPFEWILSQPSGATLAEVQARAQAAANENAWKIKAEGALDGALYGHVLVNFKTVEVDGPGSTYGGRYYVEQVRHVFSMEGYRQHFTLLRNATGQEASSLGGVSLAF